MSETTLVRERRAPAVPAAIDAARRELRENLIIYVILAIWVAWTSFHAVRDGDGFAQELVKYGLRALRATVALASLAVAAVAIRVLIARPENPSRDILRAIARLATGPVIARYVFGIATLSLFMAAFLHNKAQIPEIAPFAWDATFAAWDKMLFGGRQPWELLHPIFGNAPAIVLLDFVYAAWVPLVFLFWAWMLASDRIPTSLRRQYWMATMLSWILLGIVMATWLSSAGPCFLPQLAPDEAPAFAPLNAYLASVHETWSLASSLTKEHLWDVYAGASTEPGGISAMPSMHNAQAILFMVAAYRIRPLLGHVMAVYAVLIFVGSIMLAWHYAVDGMIGGAGAAIVWWACGFICRPRAETAR